MKAYKSKKAGARIRETYDALLDLWDVDKQEIDLDTTYGKTHIIQCGQVGNPPLILFHGVGDDAALMWIYNAKALSQRFRLYAVDTIGGPGKSTFGANYNIGFDDVVWINEILRGLQSRL